MSISEDTCILPDVIADAVVREVSAYLQTKYNVELANTEYLTMKLADYAEHIYQVRPDFRARFRCNATYGRDWLYCFMRHWLAAELKDSRIPASFANGAKLSA